MVNDSEREIKDIDVFTFSHISLEKVQIYLFSQFLLEIAELAGFSCFHVAMNSRKRRILIQNYHEGG